MELLKIGSLNIPQSRWSDVIDCFDGMYVLQIKGEEEQFIHEKINYIYLDNTLLNSFLVVCLRRFSHNKNFDWASKLCLFAVRLLNIKLLNTIKNLQIDEVHISYNDFDDSGILANVVFPVIKNKRITRAYKETRPGYQYIEKKSFQIADRIVLNCVEDQKMFEAKYGSCFFVDKEVILDLDEDFRSEKTINSVKHLPKYSETDGKKHFVILAGRVMSDSTDERSGSRLYYLPKIREMIEAGFVVHLHTKRIINDKNGINQYKRLEESSNGSFIIEPSLNLANDINAYSILSRYDYGVLHNFIEGTSNSEFDRVNIPNRYYEYQIAHVIPIVKAGETIVMERIFRDQKTGVVYNNLMELNKVQHVVFKPKSFKYYIESIYRGDINS